MTKEQFQDYLRRSTADCVRVAAGMVSSILPSEVRYNVSLNQSSDLKKSSDETIYPEDDGKTFSSLLEQDVTPLLLRGDTCPLWIDISVESANHEYTLISLVCCGRYSPDEARMYYHNRGMGPFGVKSPRLPPGYRKDEHFELCVRNTPN